MHRGLVVATLSRTDSSHIESSSVVPPSTVSAQGIGSTLSRTDASPIESSSVVPPSTVNAQGIGSTLSMCETSPIDSCAKVVSCRQEDSAVHSDRVVGRSHLESPGIQWDGASLSYNTLDCAVVDGSSELNVINSSVVPPHTCDIVPQSELDLLDTEDPSNR